MKRAGAPRAVREEHIHLFEPGRRWIKSPLSAGQRMQQCRATTKTERSGGVLCEKAARGEMTRTGAPTSGPQRRRFIPITAPGTFCAASVQLIYCPKSNQYHSRASAPLTTASRGAADQHNAGPGRNSSLVTKCVCVCGYSWDVLIKRRDRRSV